MLLNSGNDNISDMIGTALKSLITASEYDDVLKDAVILCLMLKRTYS